MSKTITVYTTATCGFCTMLKNYLASNKYPYKEIRVDLDQKAAQELYEKSGQLGVPLTVVSDEKGNEQLVLGFDRPRLQDVLIG